MSKERKALKQALESLERCVATCFDRYAHEQVMSRPEHFVNQAITAIREVLAEPEYSATSDHRLMEMPKFIKHEVESAEDWSEWVCPDPKSYLMKCCDCGLVHEAQFGVVRYKSETEREDCDMVDDPNLQAVFRMRRSEQWTPEDRAYRPGGLAQPERPAVQGEPVECMCGICKLGARKPLSDEEIKRIAAKWFLSMYWPLCNTFARAIEAAHGITGEQK